MQQLNDQAIEYFSKAIITKDSGSSLYYLNRGEVYLKTLKYPEAAEDFKKAIETDPPKVLLRESGQGLKRVHVAE